MSTRTPEDVQEINRELVLHNQWLNNKGGRKADLSFRDLSGMEIRNVRLTGAKLVGANLGRAVLAGCDLSGAELFGADLEGADLTGANLMGADFRGANLHRAVLTDCVLRGADFRTDKALADGMEQAAHQGATVMTEARLERAILCEANLTGCDLSGADLDDADLSGADLSRAVMLGVDMAGAVLTGVKLGGTVMEVGRLSPDQQAALATAGSGGVVAPSYEKLDEAEAAARIASHERWIETNGKEGKRFAIEARDVAAGGAFVGRDLSGGRLRRCRMVGTNLSKARLDMADLSYSDLTDANLEQANLRGANLRRAILVRAQMASANLNAMDMAGGRTWPSNLDGALLHDADLTNASFHAAIMRNADVGGCIIQGASFRGVDLGAVRRTAPGATETGPKERRRFRRFTTPVLLVKTQHGAFPSRDWSFGGISVFWTPDGAMKRGQTVTLMIGSDPAAAFVPVSATLTAIHAERGAASFRFVKLEDEVKALLNPLIPARYRLK